MKFTLISIIASYLSTVSKVSDAFQPLNRAPTIASATPSSKIRETTVSSPLTSRHVQKHPRRQQRPDTSRPNVPSNQKNSNPNPSANDDGGVGTSHIIFPGGGIFFYWQAGAVSYLREKGYDLSPSGGVAMTGASAGSLTATLTAAGVDFERATELALALAEEGGVWDRPLGLQGVWGEMIETWLDALLPEDAVERVGDRLSLMVTPVPSFGKEKISNFESRSDLIKTNMASVHIPWFLDGKLTTSYRGKPCIDGSFLSKPTDYDRPPPASGTCGTSSIGSIQQPSVVVTLDWTQDPVLANKSLSDAVSAISKEGIWEILERGREYAMVMEERGDFRGLPMQQ